LAGRPPRGIVHLVADGMSWGTVTCSDHLSWQTRGRGLTWMRLANDPGVVSGWMDIRSLDSLVTDSSAAASTWGCGARIPNAAVNVNSKGEPLPHLYELLGAHGWRRGLVTTAEVTHATPAGFAANVLSRGMGEEIALHYLRHRVDVILGGGIQHFAVELRRDHQDVLGEYRAAGYALVRDRDHLLSGPGGDRWLGTFTTGHLPYTVDHVQDGRLRAQVPTLAEMTQAALGQLGGSDRFILQVEGGRVDHGCHSNDAAAAFHDMLAFDEAMDVCLSFQQDHPDILLIMTTDHGNGNPGLNGMGSNYRNSSQSFARLAGIQASFTRLVPALKACGSVGEMGSVLDDMTGYRPEEWRLALLESHLKGEVRSLFEQRASDNAGLGQLLAQHTGVAFTGTSHTSDYVPIMAVGPGSERFRGFFPATDVFNHYMDFAGVDHRNPQEPLIASGPVREPWREPGTDWVHA
jgi:alkaline phosphatase